MSLKTFKSSGNPSCSMRKTYTKLGFMRRIFLF